jgi:hypothetical protein
VTAVEKDAPTAGELIWDPWQDRIDSWDSAVKWVDRVSTAVGEKALVWRGAVNAEWPLHHSLRRRVADLTGEDPKEEQLQKYEKAILQRCRSEWRFDNLKTLEIFAHMQHFGGPTRLIDVTHNPLVALWFAVEKKFDKAGEEWPETDARLYAFTIKNRITLSSREGDINWGGYSLPWDGLTASDEWGRSVNPPVLWVPPAYNERISAQNAGFLIGGTPASWGGGNNWPMSRGGSASHKIEDIRKGSSLYLRPADPQRSAQDRSYPVFNARISASAKARIRDTLEARYGFRSSTIYPDLFAMANEVLKSSLL